MVKFLYLIRHAKSSWKDMTLDDFHRPLNKRGKFDASLMGDVFYMANVTVDKIISSDAKRAKSTAILINEKLENNIDIIFENKLYDASINDIYNVIYSIEDNIDSVFIISHNPTLNMLAYELVDFDHNIPTCGVLKIQSNIKSWKNINKNNSKLILFDYPKVYKSKL